MCIGFAFVVTDIIGSSTTPGIVAVVPGISDISVIFSVITGNMVEEESSIIFDFIVLIVFESITDLLVVLAMSLVWVMILVIIPVAVFTMGSTKSDCVCLTMAGIMIHFPNHLSFWFVRHCRTTRTNLSAILNFYVGSYGRLKCGINGSGIFGSSTSSIGNGSDRSSSSYFTCASVCGYDSLI
ncbi:hypothetical protein GQX74_002306 [Glossina fuscipes]|nr:hypothetical protein GQX74_002306 [Glossina fuscipes]